MRRRRRRRGRGEEKRRSGGEEKEKRIRRTRGRGGGRRRQGEGEEEESRQGDMSPPPVAMYSPSIWMNKSPVCPLVSTKKDVFLPSSALYRPSPYAVARLASVTVCVMGHPETQYSDPISQVTPLAG